MYYAINTILKKMCLIFFAHFFILFQAQAKFNERDIVHQLETLYPSSELYPSMQFQNSRVPGNLNPCDYYHAEYSTGSFSSNSYDISDLMSQWVFPFRKSDRRENTPVGLFLVQDENGEITVSFKHIKTPPMPPPPTPLMPTGDGETYSYNEDENGEADVSFKHIKTPPMPPPPTPLMPTGDGETYSYNEDENGEADVSFKHIKTPPMPPPPTPLMPTGDGETYSYNEDENGEADVSFKHIKTPPMPPPPTPLMPTGDGETYSYNEDENVEAFLLSLQGENREVHVNTKEVNGWLVYSRGDSFLEGIHTIPCIDIKSIAQY